MAPTTCVLCLTYQRVGQPAIADREQTCGSCRVQLERDFSAVRAMYARAREAEDEVRDNRRTDAGAARDAVAWLLPMAATPPPSRHPRVSGSRERSIPINVRLVDLLGPVKPLDVSYAHAEDQDGEASIASILAAWVTRWHADHFSFQRMPDPNVESMATWLAGVRLETVMDADPRINLFAWQLRTVRRNLQSLLGDTVPYPAVMWGVPCRRCDMVSTLILDLEDPDHYRECTSCGLLQTEEEYKQWLKEIVEKLRRDRVGDGTGTSDG